MMAFVLRLLEKMRVSRCVLKTVSSRGIVNLKISSPRHQRMLSSVQNTTFANKFQYQLYKAMLKLTNEVKLLRCTSIVRVREAIRNLRFADYPDSQFEKAQALLLLRCCGKPTIDILVSERKQLTQDVIDLLTIYNTDRDINYHNTLLQVMLENDCDFLPCEILEEMRKDNIVPNQQTYMILLEYSSKKGNVTDAYNILNMIKDLKCTLTQEVYRLLMAAHFEAGNVQAAEEILNVMRDNNIIPNSNTYATLMCGYAKTGDIDNIRRVLTQSGTTVFSNRNFLDIAYTLIANKHMKYVDEVLSCTRKSNIFPRAEIEYIGKLLEIKNFENSIDMLIEITPSLVSHEHMEVFLQSILCRLMSNAVESPDVVLELCINIDKNCQIPFFIDHAIYMSYKQLNTKVTHNLFEYKMKKGETIKAHFFWPLFARTRKLCDLGGTFDELAIMIKQFKVEPCIDTLAKYIVPCIFEEWDVCRKKLLAYDISTDSVDHAIVIDLIGRCRLLDTYTYVTKFQETSYKYEILQPYLRSAINNTDDYLAYIMLLNHLNKGNLLVGGKTDKDIFMNASYNPYMEDILMDILSDSLVVQTPKIFKLVKLCWSCNIILSQPVLDAIKQLKDIPTDISDMISLMSIIPTMPNIIFTFLNNIAGDSACAKYEVTVLFEIYNMDNEKLLIDTLKLFEYREISLSFKSRIRALRFFCRVNNIAKAREQVAAIMKDNNFKHLTQNIVMSYVKLLTSHNALDEVNKFLKNVLVARGSFRMVEQETKISCQEILNKLVMDEKVEEAHQLFNSFRILNFIQGDVIQSPHLVEYYVNQGNIEMALRSFSAMCNIPQPPPHKHRLTKLIVQKKQGAALQQMINECVKVQSERQVLFELIMDLVSLNYPKKALDLYNKHKSQIRESESKYSTTIYLQDFDDHDLQRLYKNSNQLPPNLQLEILDYVGSVYIQRADWKNIKILWKYIHENCYACPESLKQSIINLLNEGDSSEREEFVQMLSKNQMENLRR